MARSREPGGVIDPLKMDRDHDGVFEYRAEVHNTGHVIPHYGN